MIMRGLTEKLAREPDFVIRHPEGIYLRRWWIIPRNSVFNVYLHQFQRSDEDRALHDHPWTFNISIIVKGKYREHIPRRIKKRRPFIPIFRIGRAPHRVELIDGKPVWTIFVTGRKVREWGFYCKQGWKHWKDFVSTRPGENGIGPGCDDEVGGVTQ